MSYRNRLSFITRTLLLVTAAMVLSCESDHNTSGSQNRVMESASGGSALDGNSAEIAGMVADYLEEYGLEKSGLALVNEVPVSHRFYDTDVSLYGEYCDYTGREIRSRRYGAVMISSDGNILRFNSVESLAGYLEEQEITGQLYRGRDAGSDDKDEVLIGIVDFISADRLMAPHSLIYHWSRLLPSPGGSYISAMDPKSDSGLLYNIKEAYPGERYNWQELREKTADLM